MCDHPVSVETLGRSIRCTDWCNFRTHKSGDWWPWHLAKTFKDKTSNPRDLIVLSLHIWSSLHSILGELLQRTCNICSSGGSYREGGTWRTVPRTSQVHHRLKTKGTLVTHCHPCHPCHPLHSSYKALAFLPAAVPIAARQQVRCVFFGCLVPLQWWLRKTRIVFRGTLLRSQTCAAAFVQQNGHLFAFASCLHYLNQAGYAKRLRMPTQPYVEFPRFLNPWYQKIAAQFNSGILQHVNPTRVWNLRPFFN